MFQRAALPCNFVPRKLENWAVHVLVLEPILTALVLLVFFFSPYRIMCVISNMCQAMCSLFTNYLISPVCSLRYRQCSISLFPAFQNE